MHRRFNSPQIGQCSVRQCSCCCADSILWVFRHLAALSIQACGNRVWFADFVVILFPYSRPCCFGVCSAAGGALPEQVLAHSAPTPKRNNNNNNNMNSHYNSEMVQSFCIGHCWFWFWAFFLFLALFVWLLGCSVARLWLFGWLSSCCLFALFGLLCGCLYSLWLW